jgi:FtsZ-interacting cell division protein YlmF
MADATPDTGPRDPRCAAVLELLYRHGTVTRDAIVKHVDAAASDVDALVGELIDAQLAERIGNRVEVAAGDGDEWTLVLKAAAIERESLAADRVRELLGRSSFGSAGARRVRRTARAQDAARAAALAKSVATLAKTGGTPVVGITDPQEETVNTAALQLRSDDEAERLRGADTLAQLLYDGDTRPTVRQAALNTLAGHVRPHTDRCDDEPVDVTAAAAALVRVGLRNRAELTYLLTYIYRDGLRRFTGALVHDPTHRDRLADMVIHRGAETLLVQLKRSTQAPCPHAEDAERPTAAAFPTTLWLMATALEIMHEQGQLSDGDTTVQEWSADTVAVSARTGHDARLIADLLRDGRSVLVDAHRMPTADACRLAWRSAQSVGVRRVWTGQVGKTAFVITPERSDTDSCRRSQDWLAKIDYESSWYRIVSTPCEKTGVHDDPGWRGCGSDRVDLGCEDRA